MLCQLVCVDRRYQRMNCFNIREIQSLLKRKFFTDLINSHDHHTFLNKTAMGLRFKTDNINALNGNTNIFYNYGIEFIPKIRNNTYQFNLKTSLNETSYFRNNFFYALISFFDKANFFSFFNSFYIFLFNNFNLFNLISSSFKNLFNLISSSFFYLSDYSIIFFFFFINIFSNFINIFSNFIKNYNYFLNIFLTSPLFLFSYMFNSLLDFCFNNIHSYLEFFNFKTSFNFLNNFSIFY